MQEDRIRRRWLDVGSVDHPMVRGVSAVCSITSIQLYPIGWLKSHPKNIVRASPVSISGSSKLADINQNLVTLFSTILSCILKLCCSTEKKFTLSIS